MKTRTPPAPTPEQAAACDALIEAGDRLRAAQIDLEQAILAYRATGASMARIGAAAGYTSAGVLGVLRRHGVAVRPERPEPTDQA